MECPLNSNYNNNICHWILLSWTDLFFKQHIYLHFSIIGVWLAIIVIVLITVKVALPPTVWQMADKSSNQVSRTTPVSRSWQTYMHILYIHSCRPTHTGTRIPKWLALISLKVIIAAKSQWLCKPDSFLTVCQLGNKPVSSTFTMMKVGTLKALCCLSLHTWHNASVFHWLHSTSHCSGCL